jgi:tetratricopeptide (TPR) repeat protein
VKALSQVVLGLSYIRYENQAGYQMAADTLRDVAETSEWAKSDVYSGQEILYLFLGNAYLLQSQLTDDQSREREKLLISSRDAFSEAIRLRSDYPRPYNGLGSVYFQMARPTKRQEECEWQWPLLEQAARMYNSALNAPAVEKPHSGWVDYRAYFGLGRVHHWIEYCDDYPNWDVPQQYYERVIAGYTTIHDPLPFLTDIAAMAYTDLGFESLVQAAMLMGSQAPKQHDAGQKLLAQSIDHYQRGFELIPESGTEEILEHGKAVLPYFLTALCLAGQVAEAQAEMDSYVALLPNREAARTEIVGRVKGCPFSE